MNNHPKHSPILEAIRAVESKARVEIRIHLSRRWLEFDVRKRALHIFSDLGMFRTRERNSVLIYFNLRKKTFAIVADEGVAKAIDQNTWNRFRSEIRSNA